MSSEAGLPHVTLQVSMLPSSHLITVSCGPEPRTPLSRACTPDPWKLPDDKGVLFQVAKLVVICCPTT